MNLWTLRWLSGAYVFEDALVMSIVQKNSQFLYDCVPSIFLLSSILREALKSTHLNRAISTEYEHQQSQPRLQQADTTRCTNGLLCGWTAQ
eukprot:1848225-Rhodomonas_salina.3